MVLKRTSHAVYDAQNIIKPKLSDSFGNSLLRPGKGNGLERIHAVQLFYPDGKIHRMPRRQAWMPAENERKAIALACQSNKSLRLG